MGKIIPFKGVKIEESEQELRELRESILEIMKPTLDEIFMHETAAEDYGEDEIIPIKHWNEVMWGAFMKNCMKIALEYNEAHWLETKEDLGLSAWAVFGTVLGALLEENKNG